ncbi:COG4315 family predicted lipoprotein [Zhihengliuella salsuginis]|uniref:Lipoprotein with Yx(FWY)xxD motif n=1 Tax=Zhihengliuella salsuginis TaxID=578222 RepID=A0ABQ3GL43_9MICC|nr:hypothetical protein [Zhihengliuella salsuginis]GHD09270.1 hypothetical protein GCM10008096_21760 [Zhihengliuella salsuginis]
MRTTRINTTTRAALRWTALLAAGGLLLSGCADGGGGAGGGYGGGGGDTETTQAPDEGMTEAVDLGAAETDLGTIVTDGEGMTLYYFTNDTAGADESACTGDCLEAWPIAVAAGEEPAVDDSITGEVGTIESPDGQLQLTLEGMPLYYFAQDMAPGDVNGQGVNEVWYVVAPDGEMITEAAE